MNKADRILHTRISVSIGTDKQSLSLPIEIVFNEFYKQDPDQSLLTRDKEWIPEAHTMSYSYWFFSKVFLDLV